MTAHSAPVVEFAATAKRYGQVTAISQLDLTLQPGEVLGLLGHNGAGKTTAMKLVLGLTRPSAGAVRVFGHDPASPQASKLRHRLGFLPENVSFYDQLSGFEALRYFGRLKNAGRAQVEQLLQRVGLRDAAGRRIKTYSKGMRQRLGLAQALLGEPKLLLLDEPTVGLDPAATRDFYTLIDELRARGVSVLLSSHVLADVERHIDRAAILGHGRLLACGSLRELRERARLPLTVRIKASKPPTLDLAPAIETRRVNGTQLELKTPQDCKMATLRQLLADPGIDDIDMEPPSLETLYAHFTLNADRERPQP